MTKKIFSTRGPRGAYKKKEEKPLEQEIRMNTLVKYVEKNGYRYMLVKVDDRPSHLAAPTALGYSGYAISSITKINKSNTFK